MFKFLQRIPLFQAVADSIYDTFHQITSPLPQEKLNTTKYNLLLMRIFSATNGYTPPIQIYLLNIFSITNGSILLISIYILNILSTTNVYTMPIPIYFPSILPTTNGSTPPIRMVLRCQFQYAR